MIDIRKLKELVRLMVTNDLSELDLRDSEEQVTLRRHHLDQAAQLTTPAGAVSVPATRTVASTAAGEAGPAEAAAAEAAGLAKVTSPMVGTFYSAPNPDSPPFVTVGGAVTPDTIVCLLEAMKIFNEIKAECSGTIAKVLIDNGEPVEFGQTLFLVKPD